MMLATLSPNVVPLGDRNRRSRQLGSLTVGPVTSPEQARIAMRVIARHVRGPVPVNELVLARVRAVPVAVGSLRRDPLSGATRVEWCHVRPGISRGEVTAAVDAYAATT
jgi:hypothetical protein